MKAKGMNKMTTPENPTLKREIGLFGGVSILTGIMVGSGIFFIGSYVLWYTKFSIGLALLVWLIGGLITLFSSLVYSELGTSLPYSGGYYVYLKEAYGKPVAFMSGFTNFVLASSGSIAALAIAFSLILSNIVSQLGGIVVGDLGQKLIAAALIIGLSVVNYLGVKIGTMIQKIFLWVKAVPILLVLVLGLILGTQTVDLTISFPDVNFLEVLAMLGFGVVATFWAYEGWTNLNNLTEEMKQPQKNLPRALILTILGVIGLYVLYNFSLYRVISIQDIQTMVESGEIYLGITAAFLLLGQVGMYLVMGTMLISVFGALSGCIMAFPRVYYAMGKDGSFVSAFGKIDAKTKTPWVAILASGVVAIVLLVFNLSDLVTFVAFGAVVFNILIIYSVFLFRKRHPELPRPYKVWGYPVVPALTIVLLVGVLVATFVQNIVPSLVGTGIILVSLPIYYLIRFLEKRAKAR
jgi:basic amino acid/polyamine antiporter, APA family